MKSKEEIWHCNAVTLHPENDIKAAVLPAMEEYAKEMAIGFAWFLINSSRDFQPSTPDGNYIDVSLKGTTSADLYSEYLCSL